MRLMNNDLLATLFGMGWDHRSVIVRAHQNRSTPLLCREIPVHVERNGAATVTSVAEDECPRWEQDAGWIHIVICYQSGGHNPGFSRYSRAAAGRKRSQRDKGGRVASGDGGRRIAAEQIDSGDHQRQPRR